MTKEDFIRKITSRKFWVALVAFINALLIAFKVPEASISQVAAIIMAFSSLLAYIFAEGWVDSNREKGGDTFNSVYNSYGGITNGDSESDSDEG